MDATKIINWRALSQELAQNPQSIRKNSIPNKYKEDINRLIEYIELALKGKNLYSEEEINKRLAKIDLFNTNEQE